MCKAECQHLETSMKELVHFYSVNFDRKQLILSIVLVLQYFCYTMKGQKYDYIQILTWKDSIYL
jgi:hypothetical protein